MQSLISSGASSVASSGASSVQSAVEGTDESGVSDALAGYEQFPIPEGEFNPADEGSLYRLFPSEIRGEDRVIEIDEAITRVYREEGQEAAVEYVNREIFEAYNINTRLPSDFPFLTEPYYHESGLVGPGSNYDHITLWTMGSVRGENNQDIFDGFQRPEMPESSPPPVFSSPEDLRGIAHQARSSYQEAETLREASWEEKWRQLATSEEYSGHFEGMNYRELPVLYNMNNRGNPDLDVEPFFTGEAGAEGPNTVEFQLMMEYIRDRDRFIAEHGDPEIYWDNMEMLQEAYPNAYELMADLKDKENEMQEITNRIQQTELSTSELLDARIELESVRSNIQDINASLEALRETVISSKAEISNGNYPDFSGDFSIDNVGVGVGSYESGRTVEDIVGQMLSRGQAQLGEANVAQDSITERIVEVANRDVAEQMTIIVDAQDSIGAANGNLEVLVEQRNIISDARAQIVEIENGINGIEGSEFAASEEGEVLLRSISGQLEQVSVAQASIRARIVEVANGDVEDQMAMIDEAQCRIANGNLEVLVEQRDIIRDARAQIVETENVINGIEGSEFAASEEGGNLLNNINEQLGEANEAQVSIRARIVEVANGDVEAQMTIIDDAKASIGAADGNLEVLVEQRDIISDARAQIVETENVINGIEGPEFAASEEVEVLLRSISGQLEQVSVAQVSTTDAIQAAAEAAAEAAEKAELFGLLSSLGLFIVLPVIKLGLGFRRGWRQKRKINKKQNIQPEYLEEYRKESKKVKEALRRQEFKSCGGAIPIIGPVGEFLYQSDKRRDNLHVEKMEQKHDEYEKGHKVFVEELQRSGLEDKEALEEAVNEAKSSKVKKLKLKIEEKSQTKKKESKAKRERRRIFGN